MHYYPFKDNKLASLATYSGFEASASVTLSKNKASTRLADLTLGEVAFIHPFKDNHLSQ